MYRILIVEDEQILREGFRHSLDFSQLNCEICGEAKNGQEGLEKIRELCPDIVFTDLRMPVMDGLEMLRLSKAQYQYEAVILSGYSEFAYAREAISLQVAEYLLKPFDRQELKAILVQLTQRLDNRRMTARKEPVDARITALMELPLELSAYCQKCADQIRSHYAEKITADAIAEELGVSADYLNRLFKRETGTTVHRYLNRYRIAQACLKILGTENKIYTIAEQCGYSDYKYFFEVFTKMTGIAPTYYKKVRQSEANVTAGSPKKE